MVKTLRDIQNELMGIKKPSSVRKSCPKTVKEAVWREYIGNKMNGKCYVCKTSINFTNFEVGHNKAQSKGGKWTVANCRPICRSCNRSMGAMSIEAFKKKYFTKKKTTTTKKKRKTKSRRTKTDQFGVPVIRLPKPPKIKF